MLRLQSTKGSVWGFAGVLAAVCLTTVALGQAAGLGDEPVAPVADARVGALVRAALTGLGLDVEGVTVGARYAAPPLGTVDVVVFEARVGEQTVTGGIEPEAGTLMSLEVAGGLALPGLEPAALPDDVSGAARAAEWFTRLGLSPDEWIPDRVQAMGSVGREPDPLQGEWRVLWSAALGDGVRASRVMHIILRARDGSLLSYLRTAPYTADFVMPEAVVTRNEAVALAAVAVRQPSWFSRKVLTSEPVVLDVYRSIGQGQDRAVTERRVVTGSRWVVLMGGSGQDSSDTRRPVVEKMRMTVFIDDQTGEVKACLPDRTDHAWVGGEWVYW
ncbi:MAG TPA: hypothetical protein DD420_04365 [Streptomyces sp.]|nr:hypothetical protein [Streptomyces sp.]